MAVLSYLLTVKQCKFSISREIQRWTRPIEAWHLSAVCLYTTECDEQCLASLVTSCRHLWLHYGTHSWTVIAASDSDGNKFNTTLHWHSIIWQTIHPSIHPSFHAPMNSNKQVWNIRARAHTNQYWTKWAVAFVLVSVYNTFLFLATCARLSWPHSAMSPR